MQAEPCSDIPSFCQQINTFSSDWTASTDHTSITHKIQTFLDANERLLFPKAGEYMQNMTVKSALENLASRITPENESTDILKQRLNLWAQRVTPVSPLPNDIWKHIFAQAATRPDYISRKQLYQISGISKKWHTLALETQINLINSREIPVRFFRFHSLAETIGWLKLVQNCDVRLKYLDLYKLRDSFHHDSYYDNEQLLVLLESCPHIETLITDMTTWSGSIENFMRAMGKMPNLKNLYISGLERLDEAQILRLAEAYPAVENILPCRLLPEGRWVFNQQEALSVLTYDKNASFAAWISPERNGIYYLAPIPGIPLSQVTPLLLENTAPLQDWPPPMLSRDFQLKVLRHQGVVVDRKEDALAKLSGMPDGSWVIWPSSRYAGSFGIVSKIPGKPLSMDNASLIMPSVDLYKAITHYQKRSLATPAATARL